MNSKEFLKFQAEQHEFTHQQINLYSHYLKRDPRQGEILYDKEKASSAQIQTRLDNIALEHGDTYIDGIQPIFDALKARHFDSSRNWVRQDTILMFYDILFVQSLRRTLNRWPSTDHISDSVNIQKIQDNVVKLWNVVKSQPEISEEQKNHIKAL